MTIILGGLSLPRPTAMNRPMPMSVAFSGPITSIQRSCFSASVQASSARTSGLTSFEARLASVRAVLEPSPMITPFSAAFTSGAVSVLVETIVSWSSFGGPSE